MAENTFKSPGFFEQEIELTAEKQRPTGVPAGIIGAAQMGPAFVPLTLGTYTDFENRFGTLTPKKFAPYAVREWLKHRQSVTFMRVLGAGANETSLQFQNTRDYGIVKNAGFYLTPTAATKSDRTQGAVQVVTAKHAIPGTADEGFPVFTDNGEFASMRETGVAASDDINLVRAVILNAEDSYFEGWSSAGATTEHAPVIDATDGTFKLRQVWDGGTDFTWGNDDATCDDDTVGNPYPNKVLTLSLDPDHTNYIGKVLNTDPNKFQEERHLLWLDFAVEDELATVDASAGSIRISTGKDSDTSGLTAGYLSNSGATDWEDALGRFDARYQAPRTTAFISQPYGNVEHNLFHFECLSDGSVANNEFKISIANIKKSANPNYKFGTFDVLVRKFADSDFQPQVLERFIECNLDPDSENFVARKIGDKKVVFNFDADLEEERRLIISGRYPNQSLNVRIVIPDTVYKREVPETALPFGFRGIPVLDIAGNLADSDAISAGAIIPPLYHTYKATKGAIKRSNATGYAFSGQAGDNERADARIYFGVKTTRIVDDAIVSSGVLQSNISSKMSKLVLAYTKFMGIQGGDVATGAFVSDADAFNDNKFSLAQVALGLRFSTDLSSDLDSVGSPTTEMKNACYIRNGVWDTAKYTISDPYDSSGYADRPTFASLVHDKTANNFNKFSKYMKFTNVFYGGWDGLNILDEDISNLNDLASTSESQGKASSDDSVDLGLTGSGNGAMMGKGKNNNVISSYRQAIKIMTDSMTVRTNLLVIPGIRDPYVANFAANNVRDYAMAMYLMDIPNYNGQDTRIFDTGSRPDVEYTSVQLEGRALDNNYVASYFPDVYITDPINNRRVLVPASVAALGALAYSDNVSYPWFAPAGFNRGALDFVENVRTRLSVSDRDDLYERRINPIANFPDGGYVIFGQKTMQQSQSALDRVNVRRLLLEVKRQVLQVASIVLFEQNTAETRARFVNLVQPRLALIQAQAGIEKFRVVCDDTNNTPQDAEENKLNGKIVLIPTRTIEFIAIDFIVTNSGVSFE